MKRAFFDRPLSARLTTAALVAGAALSAAPIGSAGPISPVSPASVPATAAVPKTATVASAALVPAVAPVRATAPIPAVASAPAPTTAPPAGAANSPIPPEPTGCLPTGDGYFRARVGGAIEANVDWPNSGTRCEGESKTKPAGVRMSFRRTFSTPPDLLFVFGLSGIQEGRPAHSAGANLTVILQGSSRIYGTLGDSRCAIDALSQRRLPDKPGADGKGPRSYRVEARGFCTQPARAVRGEGAVLVSTFDFAGVVSYDGDVPLK